MCGVTVVSNNKIVSNFRFFGTRAILLELFAGLKRSTVLGTSVSRLKLGSRV